MGKKNKYKNKIKIPNIREYDRTNGECKFVNSLLGRDLSDDCCDEVTCKDGHITKISFFNLKNQTLPNSFGSMPYLKSIYLQNNNLTGSIPPEIGDLEKLEYLYLRNNQLNGTIPPEIGRLHNLKYFDLSDNHLIGPVPSSFGNLSGLKELYLNNNNLNDTIPSEIGNLSSLEYLDLQNNNLTGSIPPEIGELSNLELLNLKNNSLSGLIPTKELEKLTNLNTINLEKNIDLYGKIPYNSKYDNCNFNETSLCYLKKDKNPKCTYPDTFYDCTICRQNSVSALVEGICLCNTGYKGVGYIECSHGATFLLNNILTMSNFILIILTITILHI
ncbi:L domain-like protein [Neocallimastix californiae]|uniref:L domain-like protein n=1 Tax=Neocallimastix californiae TaxID=1754190 RepID=A0A1Y2D487_9FUNG|nr:L domain-like protein [Neocallimastix californiae]|eukprot:ORY54091.1 L domain-like protein [Neocallimastix californiae]